MTARPERTRTYRGGMLDSTYWDKFTPRSDDIVISTSMKAGTTWVQRICAALVLQSPDLPLPLDALSPWLDMRFAVPEMTIPLLESQTHRRFIKSHIPLDTLLFYDEIKYIVVCRDGRDVLFSGYNHVRNQHPWTYEAANARTGEGILAARKKWDQETPPEMEAALLKMKPWEGEDVPFVEGQDVHAFIDTWLTKGLYPDESDGAPFWSHFTHLQSWWDWRQLPNILFVHYSDLLADLDGGMRRVAAFLDIPVDEDIWPALVDSATFKTMKSQADQTAPAQGVWRDNSKFFNRGTNGGWRDVMTEEELVLYDEVVEKTLEPAAARWMEEGSLKAGDPAKT